MAIALAIVAADVVFNDAKITKAVVNAAVDVVKAAVNDPITTIAKVAAYATGNAWAIPLIDGASTLAKGGDLGDAVKAAAISYGTQQIATKVGTPVGKAAGSYAAQQGASAATQTLVTNVMTRAAGNAAVAIVTKQDPVKAFVAGGVTAASSAVLGQIPGFEKQPRWVQNTVAATVGAAVAGQKDLSPVIAGEIVKASDIVGKALKAFDPDGTKLSDGQRAIAADAIFKTTRAALSGGDVSEELTRSLTNSAVKALGEYAKDGIKTATNAMSEQWAKINGTTDELNSIVTKSEAAATQYNSVNDSLQAAIDEQNRLKSVMDTAVAKHSGAADNTHLEAANSAVKAYNDYVTSLNTAYNDYYKPELDRLSKELTTYDKEYQDLTGVLKKDQGKLQTEIDKLTKELDPVYANSNRAFAEGLLPGFDAEAYRALNPNLPKDADPFLHYITEGMFQGLRGTKDQLKESKAIMDEILANPNVDERALQAYIDSGFFSKDFAAKTANKAYADLVAELDKRVTTEDEAKAFFKDVYGREAKSADDLAVVNQYVNMAEDAARSRFYASKLFEDDAKEFVYDGSAAKSYAAAESAAKSRGYNTFSFGGQTYTILPPQEVARQTELVQQLLTEQGKNLATASDADIQKAVSFARSVPQEVLLGGASIQDIIKGNYAGWKDGKYYSYAGDKLQGVYAVDPETGKLTLELLEISGVGADAKAEKVALKETTLQDLAFSDPEAYLQMARQFDERVKGDMGDFFTNSLNAAVLAAHATGNKTLANNIQQTLSIGTQGIGEQVENLAKFFASVTGGDYDNSVVRAAQSLQEWGAANQSASTKDQEAAIMQAVSNAEGVTGKIGAFVSASLDNPGGFFTMVSKELVQEALPLWAARGVMAAGKLAAYGTNAAIEGLESWGSNAGEVYDSAIRLGKSEAEARDMASKAGFQAFVVSSVANGIGDMPVVRRIIGDGVSASFGDLSKATAREAVTEYFDELLTNANNQRITTGQVNWDYAITAATIGAGVGAGTTAGILTGLNINQSSIVAKDVNGNNVTLGEFVSGTKQVDMSSVDMNATVGTAKDGDRVTLGGVAVMPIASGVSYDLFSTGVPSILTNQNFILGKDALGNDITLADAMGQVTEKKGFDQVYNSLLNTSTDERTAAQTTVISQAFKDAGYTTYTEDDVKALLNTENPDGINTFLQNAAEYADPRVTDTDEARQMMLDLGYTNPTDEEIAEFVGSIAEAESVKNIGAYVEPRLVTEQMARDFFASRGYTPTDEEVKQFVRQGRDIVKTQVEQELGEYVDPRQVTADEARSFFESLGYVPTEEEITQFVQQGPDVQQDLVQQLLGEYVDPRMVTTDEVRDFYAKLGFSDLLDTDAQRLAGQYDQTLLDARAREYLPIATYNTTTARIQNAEKSILEKVAEYESAGIARDQALGLAIDQVAADLGTTREELLTQIGAVEQNLGSQIQQTEQNLTGQIQSVADLLGKPARDVTQADIDFVNQMIQGEQQIDTAYDANQDGKIDQADVDLLTRLMAGDVNESWPPTAGTVWGPTGLFAQQAEEAERTRQAQAAEAERTRQAQAQQAQRTQRMGNINSMMGMLMQAPDVGGQQVTVKAPDPAKIGYIYDWSSIFANPAQEKMFVTPFSQPQPTQPMMPMQQRPMGFGFAQGGAVRGELDDVNDELLKMLKG
jgi:hypothetical protein